jgi:NAD-dependent SIR2 family protein deacetylase
MLDTNEKDSEERIALAQSLAMKERQFVLFCGSGVSKDAGIPTGWDILLEILKRLRHHIENQKLDYSTSQMESYYNTNYKGLTYSQIIERVYTYPEDQISFLQSQFEGKNPGRSHELIVEWVKSGLIRFIITTNFDNCRTYAF